MEEIHIKSEILLTAMIRLIVSFYPTILPVIGVEGMCFENVLYGKLHSSLCQVHYRLDRLLVIRQTLSLFCVFYLSYLRQFFVELRTFMYQNKSKSKEHVHVFFYLLIKYTMHTRQK